MNLQEYQLFNQLEGMLWLVIGVALLFHYLATRLRNRLTLIASLAFLVFGYSDFLESQNRTWPPSLWLLGLKGLCFLTFLLCYLQYRKSRKQ